MTNARAYPGTHPSQLPSIRDWIRESLLPGHVLWNALANEAYVRNQANQAAATDARVELEGIETAKLFWVPSAEAEIVVSASAEMPYDLVLTPETVPYPSGLALLETEFFGIDAMTGEPMGWSTKALRWSPMLIQDVDGTPLGDGISMSSWAFNATTFGREMWLPLGRTDWLHGQPWQEYFNDPDPMTLACVHEDRSKFMALWGLMNTQEPMVYRPTRAEARRDARIAAPSRERTIHVVKWDPKRYVRDNPTDDNGRHVHVRFHVDGFWRRQSYGPRHSLRKWKYIPPHWRGPEGAPVKGERITINKVVAHD